jgi:salicylate hydroxylase
MVSKIAIAGAGIGGLTTACCLLKAGYGVELFEQAAELSEIGAGIQLSANAMHVLDDLSSGRQLPAFRSVLALTFFVYMIQEK